MRRKLSRIVVARWIGLALGVLAFGANGVRASELQWEGALELQFLALGPPVVLTGGGVATVNAGLRLESLALDGGITGTAAVPITDPEVTAVGFIAIEATPSLGAGTLSPFWPTAPASQPQLGNAALPVSGHARACYIFAACTSFLGLDLTASSGATGVGVGGTLTGGGFGTLRVSVDAAPWTIRTASVSVPTSAGGSIAVPDFGWRHGPVSFTGTTLLTGGELQLVTPIQVTSNDGDVLTGFGRLQVRFVPEPDVRLLLSVGLLGLGILRVLRAVRAGHERSRHHA